MIKIYLKYSSVILIFSLSFIILINNSRIKTDHELTDNQKYLKHAIVEHKFNEGNFGFIRINFLHVNYYGTGSAEEMNVAAATSLFLISSFIILYFFPGRKYFFPENFLFAAGFKNSLFRPPKHSH